jgi:transposase InsO family protein
MPFGVCTMSEQRKSLVEEIKSGEHGISALCRKYGVSRPTAYKWLSRSKSGYSMENMSKAPLKSPCKTSVPVEEMVKQARHKHPCWGGRKLKAYLERAGEAHVPSASTITAILHRNSLISKEASLAAKPFKRFERANPNDLWQTDFKGHFAMENGSRCHPLTVTDDMSRFSLCISAKDNERLTGVKDSFRSLFMEHGLPKAVLCDNGNPWGTGAFFGYTKFEVFLMDYGVLPIHGRPLHPQTQGKEERFHRTLKRELLARVSMRDLNHAQKEFDTFRLEYNEERPHCAIGYAVPADRYRDSDRAAPEKVQKWEYPEKSHVRKMRKNGYISFSNGLYYLSEAFDGIEIALVKTLDDSLVDVIYRNFRIAVINLKQRVFISRKITRLGKNM